MAEFWWGESPKGEVRHHLHYYPACRGKCLPILRHMLRGLDVEKGSPETAVGEPLEVVYEDGWLAVVDKPAGMKSVPGRGGGTSVLEEMRLRHPDKPQLALAHRLDMDTSGLLLVAFDIETYKKLQTQFLRREVRKRYTALLDGVTCRPVHGEIRLPMRPDPLDRPYQKVDFAGGKEAVTEYRILETKGNTTRVALFPAHRAHPPAAPALRTRRRTGRAHHRRPALRPRPRPPMPARRAAGVHTPRDRQEDDIRAASGVLRKKTPSPKPPDTHPKPPEGMELNMPCRFVYSQGTSG